MFLGSFPDIHGKNLETTIRFGSAILDEKSDEAPGQAERENAIAGDGSFF